MDENIEDAFNMKKTGKTKKILGYTCNEYVATTDDGTSEMWVTKKIRQ